MEMDGVSSTSSQSPSVHVMHQLSCLSLDGPKLHASRDAQRAGSSASSFAHKQASGLKAGMGILKMATSQWKQEKRTQSGAVIAKMRGSSGGLPCKRSPLDQLAALLLRGQTRLRQLGAPHRQDSQCSTKPQNCKRVVVLGAPRVGKTSILRRFLRDGFVEEYKPTSEDFHRKLFRIRGETYQIDILDASGERSFPAKRRLSILTGDIFLLVFSLDDRSSFEEVCALRAEILAAKTKLFKSNAPGQPAQVPLIVCANKADLPPTERLDVSRSEVLQALGEDCAYFETSARDSTNLEKVFETLAKRGGLPTETVPSQHRKVSLRSYLAVRTGRVSGRGRQTASCDDDPCGALFPLARRPSFSTDLRQVMGLHAAPKPGKPPEK
ncbi:dexamethasone-induced Ras-related protein 1 [Lampris incognitus]|uniref:dexamethasone-induced Ras-related protein 1 n=1 Tax=Lampris incognitus TaxID=2546036 RepID=UPI0024B4CD13|nr:dexamethasone-induced Ras-related protein 1 [Lampris incognitus]